MIKQMICIQRFEGFYNGRKPIVDLSIDNRKEMKRVIEERLLTIYLCALFRWYKPRYPLERARSRRVGNETAEV